MSLPAMLLEETMGEILQENQFARNIVEAVSSNASKSSSISDGPQTPATERGKREKQALQQSEFHARRKIEKQAMLQATRSESDIQRAKSRIDFKKSSPIEKRDCDKENCRYIANRISPRNRPWARKTVLFPNPLFHSSSSKSQQHQKFSKDREIPYKFLIKSPPLIKRPAKASSAAKMKRPSSPARVVSKLASPLRSRVCVEKSEGALDAGKPRRSFSPSRVANMLASPLKSRNCVEKREGALGKPRFRRSISPSRIVNRLASPLKSRNCVEKSEGVLGAGKPIRSFSPLMVVNRLASPLKSKNCVKCEGALGVGRPIRSFSPFRVVNRLASPLKNRDCCVEKSEGNPRRSFSPSRVVNRLVSPLKTRKSVEKNGAVNVMRGLKQRPVSVSVELSTRRA